MTVNRRTTGLLRDCDRSPSSGTIPPTCPPPSLRVSVASGLPPETTTLRRLCQPGPRSSCQHLTLYDHCKGGVASQPEEAVTHLRWDSRLGARHVPPGDLDRAVAAHGRPGGVLDRYSAAAGMGAAGVLVIGASQSSTTRKAMPALMGVASVALLMGCTSSGRTPTISQAVPSASSVAGSPTSPARSVLRVTVVNDTPVPVQVLCPDCGPSGFDLGPGGRRTLTPSSSDRLTFQRTGKITCSLFGYNEVDSPQDPSAPPAIVRISQAGNCPAR